MWQWDLLQEMDELRREIDSAFRGFGRCSWGDQLFFPGISTSTYPRLNLREDNDNYYVQALIPGVEPEKLDISANQQNITIAGERAEAQAQQDSFWHRRERGGGSFLRTLELPVAIDADNVAAQFKNGVLELTLPKSAEQRPRRIEVKPQ